MADAQDSKSCGGDFVWVQVPLSALNLIERIPETQWFPVFSFTQNTKRGQKGGKLFLFYIHLSAIPCSNPAGWNLHPNVITDRSGCSTQILYNF